ncbi:hypothetical protein N752_26275 [Desulforamulus aquiferis]|nr:CoA protein activase [Desulforamulus aquiferis]RYD02216.1 hypothetical protein N752_26275 [Desulforamulus aquiferis]
MLKVTFPRMGHSYIAFKMLLEDLGNEVIVPPRPSKKTLDLGVQYSPEFTCLPFKILMGTYLEAIQMGANTLVTSGGNGPCRAGLYAQVHQRIIEDLGHQINMICFEAPLSHPIDFLKKVKFLNSSKLSYLSVWQAIKKGWHKLKALDNIEKLTHQIRPRERDNGTTSRVYRQAQNWLGQASTIKDIDEAYQEAVKSLNNIPQAQDRLIIKIGMVGEIYVLLEPASNHEIEEVLGSLGVEIERSMFLTGWTKDNLNEKCNEVVTCHNAAKPWIPVAIGGHGQDTVGHVILYSQRGFDGVIQLAPFTCIPEIVSKTVLTQVSKQHNIPILTFFLDEQTGKAVWLPDWKPL